MINDYTKYAFSSGSRDTYGDAWPGLVDVNWQNGFPYCNHNLCQFAGDIELACSGSTGKIIFHSTGDYIYCNEAGWINVSDNLVTDGNIRAGDYSSSSADWRNVLATKDVYIGFRPEGSPNTDLHLYFYDNDSYTGQYLTWDTSARSFVFSEKLEVESQLGIADPGVNSYTTLKMRDKCYLRSYDTGTSAGIQYSWDSGNTWYNLLSSYEASGSIYPLYDVISRGNDAGAQDIINLNSITFGNDVLNIKASGSNDYSYIGADGTIHRSAVLEFSGSYKDSTGQHNHNGVIYYTPYWQKVGDTYGSFGLTGDLTLYDPNDGGYCGLTCANITLLSNDVFTSGEGSAYLYLIGDSRIESIKSLTDGTSFNIIGADTVSISGDVVELSGSLKTNGSSIDINADYVSGDEDALIYANSRAMYFGFDYGENCFVSTKNIKTYGNNITFGDSTATSDKYLIADIGSGSSNPSIKYDKDSGYWTFSNGTFSGSYIGVIGTLQDVLENGSIADIPINITASGSILNTLTTVSDATIGGNQSVIGNLNVNGNILNTAGIFSTAYVEAHESLYSDHNLYLGYDQADADQYIYFHETSNTGRYLKWSDTNNRFEFNDDIYTSGIITAATSGSIMNTLTVVDDLTVGDDVKVVGDQIVNGTITALTSGSIMPTLTLSNVLMANTITVAGVMLVEAPGYVWCEGSGKYFGNLLLGNVEEDRYIYFYNAGSVTGEYLKWSDGSDRFEFSDDVYIAGTLNATGAATLVSGSVAAGLRVTGNLQVDGVISTPSGYIGDIQTSARSTDVELTSTTATYSNGTSSGLAITLTPGKWAITYNLAVYETDSAAGDYGNYFWLEDGSAIVANSYAQQSPRNNGAGQYYTVTHTIYVSLAASTTITLYGAKQSGLDTLTLKGGAATANRTSLTAIRIA